MSQIHTTARYAILGKPGTGKTTLMRGIVEEEILPQGWIEGIWSNTPIYTQHNSHDWRLPHTKDCPLHPLYHEVHYGKQYERARRGIAIFDEISKIFPSRAVGHNRTEQWELIQGIVTNVRRRENWMIYTDQWRRGADIMIRTIVDRVFLPHIDKGDLNHKEADTPLFYETFQPGSTEFTELENPTANMVTNKTQMMVKDIFMLFSTREQVAMTYNPPFKVESWTMRFVKWCAHHNYIIREQKEGVIRNIINLYQIKKKQYISSKELSAVMGKLKVDGHI
jgi:hypothetical protein